MVTDQVPELILGDPFGEYKATTCTASGTILKGDCVTLVADPSTPNEEYPIVVSSSNGDYSFGVAMKAATDGQLLPVLNLGLVKVTATWTDIDPGDSLLAYRNATVAGVKTSTALAGFAKAYSAMGSGDTGLIYVSGGAA